MITLEVETVRNTGSASNSERCARCMAKVEKVSTLGIKKLYYNILCMNFAINDFAKPSQRS